VPSFSPTLYYLFICCQHILIHFLPNCFKVHVEGSALVYLHQYDHGVIAPNTRRFKLNPWTTAVRPIDLLPIPPISVRTWAPFRNWPMIVGLRIPYRSQQLPSGSTGRKKYQLRNPLFLVFSIYIRLHQVGSTGKWLNHCRDHWLGHWHEVRYTHWLYFGVCESMKPCRQVFSL